MKTRTITLKHLFFTSFAVALLFAGCSKEEALPGDDGHRPVNFNAGIKTILTGTDASRTRTALDDNGQALWKQGDEVGIYMVTTGGTIPDHIASGAENIRYSVDPTSGALSPAGITSIYYPKTEAVDFIAYYPFGSLLQNSTMDVKLTDQTTTDKQSALDILYSDNAKNIRSNKQPVNLEFRHLFGNIKLNITFDDGLIVGNITKVELSGMPEGCVFSLKDGSINQTYPPKPDAPLSALKLSTATAGADATFTAVVVPQEANTYQNRTIIVTVDGSKYTGKIPDKDTFIANSRCVYPVTVKKNGLDVGNMTITDWEQHDNGADSATQI